MALNEGMMDTATAILVEVLNFIGIVTKQIKQGRISKSFVYKYSKLSLTGQFSEKYVMKLIGKKDVEDALKKLDRLTQEEARMASAQLLKVANTIDNRVEGIADNVLVVDNRLVGVDERVACVDERVVGVDDRMKDVHDDVDQIKRS